MNRSLSHSWARHSSSLLFWMLATLLPFTSSYASTAQPSIKITAESGQGVNPTTACLGRNTGFTAAVSGTGTTAVTWALNGGGTITSAGAYSAPVTMPASPTVVVTATMVSQPSVSASY